jgi:hypothetical protein
MRAGLARGIVFGFPLSLLLWTLILLPVYWPLFYADHNKPKVLAAAPRDLALAMTTKTRAVENSASIRNHPYSDPLVKSLNKRCPQSRGA